jgi:DNA-directed RNA polymerase subunit alpha
MPDYNIVLPSKPRVVFEEGFSGAYEIDGLYPGYGHTLGNSLRRIILSSLPGAAVISVKIDGVSHEFSTINGIKEDVITILLNLKRVRLSMATDEPQVLTIKAKGIGKITAADIKAPGQVAILNPELYIMELTDKTAAFSAEVMVEKGLGYVPKEILQKDRVEIGSIALDAIFTPIRRVNYEVENMRVGDRTDFNRLKLFIETDGTVTPREALENSIEIMIHQLKAIIGFKEEEIAELGEAPKEVNTETATTESSAKSLDSEFLKTRIESIEGLSSRTANALANANIRTMGGLVRKKEDDILEIEGIGAKGLGEIREMLIVHGATLKQ